MKNCTRLPLVSFGWHPGASSGIMCGPATGLAGARTAVCLQWGMVDERGSWRPVPDKPGANTTGGVAVASCPGGTRGPFSDGAYFTLVGSAFLV